MSATCWSYVVAAAFTQGKLQFTTGPVTANYIYPACCTCFCCHLAPNVTFEFVTFATKKKKFFLNYFNFTLIPFWKPQPLDL